MFVAVGKFEAVAMLEDVAEEPGLQLVGGAHAGFPLVELCRRPQLIVFAVEAETAVFAVAVAENVFAVAVAGHVFAEAVAGHVFAVVTGNWFVVVVVGSCFAVEVEIADLT